MTGWTLALCIASNKTLDSTDDWDKRGDNFCPNIKRCLNQSSVVDYQFAFRVSCKKTCQLYGLLHCPVQHNAIFVPVVCLSASACIVFVCLCFFGSLSVSVCLCLCVYLQRLTTRDLSSSGRGQYPSHHPLCLFFSKRNFRFSFLFLMCTFLFFF